MAQGKKTWLKWRRWRMRNSLIFEARSAAILYQLSSVFLNGCPKHEIGWPFLFKPYR
jgi:hypothetical protein